MEKVHRIEATIVWRDLLDNDDYFQVEVLEVIDSGAHRPRIKALYEDGSVFVQKEFHLSDIILASITYYDDQYPDGVSESFVEADVSQEDALRNLDHLFSAYEVVTSILDEEPEEETHVTKSIYGPKRLEVTLRRRDLKAVDYSTRDHCFVELVVLRLVSPKEPFPDYTLHGRAKLGIRGNLDDDISCYTSETYYLTRIAVCSGGMEAWHQVTPYTLSHEQQESAWQNLDRLLSKFRPSELLVVDRWQKAGSIIHLTGNGAVDTGLALATRLRRERLRANVHNSGDKSWLKPEPGAWDKNNKRSPHFRVAGDEVGALIHRKQQETREEEHGGKDPAKVLREMLEPPEEEVEEKKEEAGTDAASSVSGGYTPGSKSGDDECDDCGGFDCPAAWCRNPELGAFGATLY